VRQAANAVAATRRLAAKVTAIPAVPSVREGTPDRMAYAFAGAALLALAAMGAVTMTRATRRMLT
jgi:hypothetical protein